MPLELADKLCGATYFNSLGVISVEHVSLVFEVYTFRLLKVPMYYLVITSRQINARCSHCCNLCKRSSLSPAGGVMLGRVISYFAVIGWKVVPRPVLTPLSFR